jgi:hypothetical protein
MLRIPPAVNCDPLPEGEIIVGTFEDHHFGRLDPAEPLELREFELAVRGLFDDDGGEPGLFSDDETRSLIKSIIDKVKLQRRVRTLRNEKPGCTVSVRGALCALLWIVALTRTRLGCVLFQGHPETYRPAWDHCG